ncbi:hypothetical protein [Shinella sp.]|nr:hypothetical protein [Shinella sp.]MDX3976144.1 hypothetical protein [Shinella sp.]
MAYDWDGARTRRIRTARRAVAATFFLMPLLAVAAALFNFTG